VDHYLSSSVHHQLASEYIQSLLSLRRICGNLQKPHTYIADTLEASGQNPPRVVAPIVEEEDTLEANETCMYQILTYPVNQKGVSYTQIKLLNALP
jgi:hypothetical protein